MIIVRNDYIQAIIIQIKKLFPEIQLIKDIMFKQEDQLKQNKLKGFLIQILGKKIDKISSSQMKKIDWLVKKQNRKLTGQWSLKLDSFIADSFPKRSRPAIRQSILKQFDYQKKRYPLVVETFCQLKQKKIDLHIIESVKTDPSMQESRTMLDFQLKTKERIETTLETSISVQDFLQKQLYFIIDILQRRSSLVDYFNWLVDQASQASNSKISKIFLQITFIDFTILLMKMTNRNDTIPVLLSQQSAPIPLFYLVKQQEYNDRKSIINILGANKYPLIINIWTEEMVNLMKTVGNNYKQKMYFPELMDIDKKYFQGSSFEGNINLFKITLKSNRKQILMVNFINYKKQSLISLQTKSKLIQKISKYASLIIYNIDADSILDNLSIFKNYTFSKKDVKKICIVQLSQGNVVKSSIQQTINMIFKEKSQSEISQENGFFMFEREGFNEIQQTQLQVQQKKQGQQKDNELKKFWSQFENTDWKQQQYIDFQPYLIVSKQDKKNQSTQAIKSENIKSFIKKYLIDANPDREALLPLSFYARKLNKLKGDIKNINIHPIQQIKQSEITKESQGQILLKLLQEESNLKQKMKQPIQTQFLKECQQFLRDANDDITLNMFVQILIQETNTNICTKMAQLQGSISKQTDKKEKQFKKKEAEILEKRISIDHIIQELSAYNELTIDKRAEKPSSYYQSYIDNYYNKCFKSLFPFCVIDGETSNFGNEGLKRFFKNINDQFNQNVFVISIIGTKSSGKSTLLNYLFRYNIHMREDPYAKGVYMGFCKISQKKIIVLDTQGIMTIDITRQQGYKFDSEQVGRLFATFDHQVASILMKQSNLIIISSLLQEDRNDKTKIVIPEQVALVFGICYKVLDALHANNQSQSFMLSKNIILVLSNPFQTQMKHIPCPKTIINNLIDKITPILRNSVQNISDGEQNTKILFQKIFRLQQQNIFFLPNLQKDSQFSLQRRVNQTYGIQILRIRNRAIQIMDQMQQLSIQLETAQEFIKDSMVNWNTILLTAQDIVKAKTVNQSYVKSQLYYIYRECYKQILIKINDAFNARYKTLKNNSQIGQLTLSSQQLKGRIKDQDNVKLNYAWEYFKKYLLDNFIKTFNSKQNDKESKTIVSIAFKIFHDKAINVCEKIQWVNEYSSIIKRSLDSLLWKNIKIYYEKFKITFEEVTLSIFQDEVKKKLKDGVIKDSNQFKKYADQFQKKKKDMLYKARKQLQKITSLTDNRGDIKLEYSRTFNTIFQSSHIFLKELSIKHVKDCIDFDDQIRNQYVAHLNQLFSFANEEQVPQKTKAALVRIIQEKITQFQEELQSDINQKKGQQLTQADLQIMFAFVNDKIDKIIEEAHQETIKISKGTNNNGESQKYFKIQEKVFDRRSQLNPSDFDGVDDEQKQQKKQELRRYLIRLQNKIENIFAEKIMLNRINFKIILISKLFKGVVNITYRQGITKMSNLKKTFQKKIDDIFDKVALEQFSSSLSLDIIDYKKELTQNFKIEFQNVYTARINLVKDNELYLLTRQERLIKETFDNQNISKKTAKPEDYVECYKYIMNPPYYTYEAIKKQLLYQSQIKVDGQKAQKNIKKRAQDFIIYGEKKDKEFIKSKFYRVDCLLELKLVSRQYAVSEISKQLNKMINDKKFSETLQQNAKKQDVAKYIEQNQESLTGCTSCCPYCGAKCGHLSKHGGNHQAVRHTILAFGGSRDQNGRFLLQRCFDKSLQNNYWGLDNQIAAKNYYVLAQNKFQLWVGNLPNFLTIRDMPKVQNYINIWVNIQPRIIDSWKKKYPQLRCLEANFQSADLNAKIRSPQPLYIPYQDYYSFVIKNKTDTSEKKADQKKK